MLECQKFFAQFFADFFHGEDISVDLRHIFLLFYINNKERNYMMHDMNLFEEEGFYFL